MCEHEASSIIVDSPLSNQKPEPAMVQIAAQLYFFFSLSGSSETGRISFFFGHVAIIGQLHRK